MRKGWEYKKLGEVTSFFRGLTYSGKDEVDKSNNIVLRSNNIDLSTNSLNFDELKFISDSITIPQDKKLRKNSIFMCMSNGSKQHLGKVAFIEKEYPYAFGGFMGLIVPNEDKLVPKFTYYYFCSQKFKAYLSAIGNGANINNIKYIDIAKDSIPLPPLSTQLAIVSELDKINELIRLKKEQLKDFDNLAQSLFYEMFEEGKCLRKKLKDIVKIQSGQVSPLEEPYSEMIHIGPANIESNTGRLLNLKTAKEENLISGKYLFDSSMVLYSKIRPNLNKVTIPSFEGICSADMYPIIPLESIDKNFLLFLLKQKDFLTYAISNSGRANIPKINREALLNYEAILPPLPLQHLFAQRIEQIEHQKAEVQKAITDLETLLASRMQYWFE